MSERVAIPKKLRFEVFKRDSFTCQYCGRKSPEAVLHCDHMKPVAEGGATELLNLVTACDGCNLGKGAVQLDDMSAIERQRRQIEELNERRIQLEMMLEWRNELARHQIDEVQAVADAMSARSKFRPNENGKAKIRGWIKKHGLSEVLASMDEAFDRHLTNDSQATWEFAFKKIPSVANLRAQEKIDPHIRKLLYIQAILRNRWEIDDLDCVALLRKRLDAGYSIEALELAARAVRLNDNWKDLDEAALIIMKPSAPQAEFGESEDEQSQDEPDITWGPETQVLCRMFADCFGNPIVREMLQLVSDWVWIDGYTDGKEIAHADDIPYLRSLCAVGLINHIYGCNDIIKKSSAGDVVWNFRYRPVRPIEVANCFNRFGALRLSFWSNPSSFSPVDMVH